MNGSNAIAGALARADNESDWKNWPDWENEDNFPNWENSGGNPPK